MSTKISMSALSSQRRLFHSSFPPPKNVGFVNLSISYGRNDIISTGEESTRFGLTMAHFDIIMFQVKVESHVFFFISSQVASHQNNE